MLSGVGCLYTKTVLSGGDDSLKSNFLLGKAFSAEC